MHLVVSRWNVGLFTLIVRTRMWNRSTCSAEFVVMFHLRSTPFTYGVNMMIIIRITFANPNHIDHDLHSSRPPAEQTYYLNPDNMISHLTHFVPLCISKISNIVSNSNFSAVRCCTRVPSAMSVSPTYRQNRCDDLRDKSAQGVLLFCSTDMFFQLRQLCCAQTSPARINIPTKLMVDRMFFSFSDSLV